MQQTRGEKNTRVNCNKPRNLIYIYILISRLIFLFRFLYSIIFINVSQQDLILSSFCSFKSILITRDERELVHGLDKNQTSITDRVNFLVEIFEDPIPSKIPSNEIQYYRVFVCSS